MKKLVLFWICIVGLSMTGCRAGQQEIERNNAAESTVGQQPEEPVTEEAVTEEPVPEEATEAELQSREQIMEESVGYTNLQQIALDSTWEYADHSKINTGAAVLYLASEESGRKGIVIGVNAGHGTAGGAKVKTLCHPDGSAKVTGGSTAAGATEAAAVSAGMTFQDGTP